MKERVEAAQQQYIKVSGTSDSDLDALDAFITWQHGPSRLQEYFAANLAALSIKANNSQAGTNQLAAHYLTAYLYAPIDEEFMRVAGFDPAKNTINTRQKYLSNEELSALANTVARAESLSPDALYDREVVTLYRDTVPMYVDSVLLLAKLSAYPEQKVAIADQRLKVCQNILTKWKDFTAAVSSDDINDPAVRISSLKTSVAIAGKAAACVANSSALEPVSPPSDPLKDPKKVEILQALLTNGVAAPVLLPNTYKVVEHSAQLRFSELYSKLTEFENATVTFAKTKPPTAQVKPRLLSIRHTR